MRIERIAIVGVGLIGASFALAVKAAGFAGEIVGIDSPEALQRASSRGAIDRAEPDFESAVRGAQLIVLAAPVDANVAAVRSLASIADADALITDVGSTKQVISNVAAEVFGANANLRFLPGHPIAGKEVSGAEHADPDLFRGRPWVLTPAGGRRTLIDPRLNRTFHTDFIQLLERIGAKVVVTDPATHDRILAFSSHLPQLVATALALAVMDGVEDETALRDLSGRALRDMTRLAASDADVWTSIVETNRENIEAALAAVEAKIRDLRTAIGSPEFREQFERARSFNPDAEPKPKDDTEPPKFW